jgi:hypothetical protein
VSLGVQVDPAVFFEGGDTTASVRATASVEQYTGELGTASSFAVNGAVQHQVDGRTLVRLNGSAASTRSAIRDFLRNPAFFDGSLQAPGVGGDFSAGAVGPSSPPSGSAPVIDPFYPDFLEPFAGRTRSYRIGASVSRALSARDSLAIDAGVRWTNSADVRASDYRAETASLLYERKLSERTALSATVTGGRADYGRRNGVPGGHSTYVTPLLGVQFRLSETITSHASAGISMTRIDDPSAPAVTRVTFAGKFDICQRQDRGSVCATAARDVQPTAYAGVTTVTSAGLTASRVLGPKDRAAISALFTRRGTSHSTALPGVAEPQSIVAVSARYSREIGERLHAFVEPSYSRTSRSFDGGRQNFQISLGIRFRLGNTNE